MANQNRIITLNFNWINVSPTQKIFSETIHWSGSCKPLQTYFLTDYKARVRVQFTFVWDLKLLFYLLRNCSSLSFFFKVPLSLTQKNEEFFRGSSQSTAAVQVALVGIFWMSLLTWKELEKSGHCMKKCPNPSDWVKIL